MNTAEVTWPAYGMMSCTVVLSGNYAIFGVQTALMPGDTYRAKRENALRLTIDDMKRLREWDHGDDGGGRSKQTVWTCGVT